MRTLLLSTILLTGLTGAALAQPAYPPIPELRPEVIPPPPGARVLWEPGHWHWNGVQYVWLGGHYIQRRPNYVHYVPGHWAAGPRGLALDPGALGLTARHT